MATTTTTTTLGNEQIGDAAGAIWRHLDVNGPCAITKLIKEIDQPRDLVMQGLGWLAREDKIQIEENSRSRIVSLRNGV